MTIRDLIQKLLEYNLDIEVGTGTHIDYDESEDDSKIYIG